MSITVDHTPTNLESLLSQHLLEELKEYAIFMIGADGFIKTWNKGVNVLLGYDETEFIGKPFSLIFTEADTTSGVPDSELKRAQKEGKAQDERWHKKKNGDTFWANGLVTTMKDDAGNFVGYAKIMRDQTAKKRLEEDLIAQSNALSNANKNLTHFAGVVSHDLNAPLQTVYGFAHELRSHAQLDEEGKESLDYIVSGAEKMLSLIHELLQESTGALETNLHLLEPSQALKEALHDLTGAIKENGAKISNDDLPPMWGTELGLKRIFQNLIQNAIKYHRPGVPPQIHISATLKPEGPAISVTDNGIGIKEKDRKRIFEPYQRGESGQEGFGIGLAACKKILDQLGGEMWVEPNPTGGSIFSFSIPHPVVESELKALKQNASQGSVL